MPYNPGDRRDLESRRMRMRMRMNMNNLDDLLTDLPEKWVRV